MGHSHAHGGEGYLTSRSSAVSTGCSASALPGWGRSASSTEHSCECRAASVALRGCGALHSSPSFSSRHLPQRLSQLLPGPAWATEKLVAGVASRHSTKPRGVALAVAFHDARAVPCERHPRSSALAAQGGEMPHAFPQCKSFAPLALRKRKCLLRARASRPRASADRTARLPLVRAACLRRQLSKEPGGTEARGRLQRSFRGRAGSSLLSGGPVRRACQRSKLRQAAALRGCSIGCRRTLGHCPGTALATT
mmetsp:Transcript_45022/g.97778  ORF Transcript_45022/g.97778 Transcript_45022/m.97778 type:complete len:252 (-) Transcript_45022:948-1703(-)